MQNYYIDAKTVLLSSKNAEFEICILHRINGLQWSATGKNTGIAIHCRLHPGFSKRGLFAPALNYSKKTPKIRAFSSNLQAFQSK